MRRNQKTSTTRKEEQGESFMQVRFIRALVAALACLVCGAASADRGMRVEASWNTGAGILVAGQATTAGAPRISIGRLLPSGDADPSFGSGGWLDYPALPWVAAIHAAAITATVDGKVLVATLQDTQLVYVQLLGNGATDYSVSGVTFGAFVDNAGASLSVSALYSEAPNAFLAVGSFSGAETGNVRSAAIARYNFGARDLSFGYGTGLRTYNLGANGSELRSFVALPNGDLVAVGYAVPGNQRAWLIAKFTAPSRDLDFRFGVTNIGETIVPSLADAASSITVSAQTGAFIVSGGTGYHMLDGTPSGKLMALQFGAYGNSGNFTRDVHFDAYAPAIVDATSKAAFEVPGGANIVYAGTVFDPLTGRSYFGRALTGPLIYGPQGVLGPSVADADDVMVAAYPAGADQFVAVGTREFAQSDELLRARYFYDGTFDTDFSGGDNDATPNPFAFPSDFYFDRGATAQSAPVRIAGINVAAPISVSGGEYQVPCGSGAWRSDADFIQNGQFVCVRQPVAATPDTTVTLTLTIGGVQGTYAVTTGSVPDTHLGATPPADSGPNVSFSYFFTGEAAASAVTYECRIDGAAFASCAPSGISFTGLAAGGHSFDVRAVDGWGADATPASYSWIVHGLPDTVITAQPAAVTNQTLAIFAFNSPDSSATFQCSLDGAAFAACTSSKAYSNLADGNHAFAVRATNVAGADPTPASYAWVIDRTPPDTTLTSGPSGLVASGSATFTFGSPDSGATFECRLDNGPFVACSSPMTYTGLGTSDHSFQVRAVDTAGNTDGTPATRTWTVDATPPDTAFFVNPPALTGSTATFSFFSNESVTYQCSLDGAAWTSCLPLLSYTGLADGLHTFSARAIDMAGNVDPTPASVTWTVDGTPPDTVITLAPAGFVNTSSVTIQFSSPSPDATSFRCTLVNRGITTCTSPMVYGNLAEGSYSFQVQAIDAAGNVDPTPATANWIVDTTPPDTFMTSQPAAITNQVSATFSFASNEGSSSFECQLDGSAFASCASSAVYLGLADGSHTFSVRARDAAGNVDASPASVTWTVDTVSPRTSIISAPPLFSNGTGAQFTISSSEGGTTSQCSLDASPWTPCGTNVPLAYSGLADGSHTFMAYSVDVAGNADQSVATYTWTVDTVPPETTVTSQPSTWTSASTATFTFSANEAGATFVCYSSAAPGNGTFQPCTSPTTYGGLTQQGNYLFEVYAIDRAGNADATPAQVVWNVDNVAPDTIVTSGPPSLSNSSSATFTFDANETQVTYQCRMDAMAFAACTSPVSYAGLADGSHAFQVRSTDLAGNVDATPYSLAWTIDTTAATATITSGPTGSVSSTSATFTYASSEPGSTFDCAIDAAALASCPGGTRAYSGLTQGSHTFRVRARDPAGNVGAVASRSWTADTIAPDTTITGGPSGTNNPNTATLTFTATEPGSTFECKLDSASFAACASPKAYSSLARGSHTFQVRAKDAAGNLDSTPATRTWSSK
jgi:hypothetical protein